MLPSAEPRSFLTGRSQRNHLETLKYIRTLRGVIQLMFAERAICAHPIFQCYPGSFHPTRSFLTDLLNASIFSIVPVRSLNFLA